MVKLLIVEYDDKSKALYRKEFQKEGYEVLLVQNTGEALQKMQDFNPDMFVLDLNLPDMDGIAVINSIIQTNKFLPIIINSATCRQKNNFNCWGTKTYLIKSTDVFELKNKVSEYLSSQKSFTVLLPVSKNGTKQLLFFSE